MLERLREARKNESGFTLIELLIVIVILGVLSGIVVFAVQAFNDDGKTSACKTDKKSVEIAVEAFYAKAVPHAYPASLDALVTGGYLKQKPDTANYTISYNPGTGAVTSANC